MELSNKWVKKAKKRANLKVYICAHIHRTTYKLNQKGKKKKVAGKMEVHIIAYTSKHKKQRAILSRIEEKTLIRLFLSLVAG